MRFDRISRRLDNNGIGIPAAKVNGKLERACAFLESTSPSRPSVMTIRKRLELFLGKYTVDSPGNAPYSLAIDTVDTHDSTVTIRTALKQN
jgi:hypothetical protein